MNVALTQLGNSGGQPYWEFCGWPERVEWCACFITWCGEQCGYIEAGLLPMTSSPWVQTEFFKEKNRWMDGGVTPNPGMVIFFDWYGNGLPDHVGFVEYVEDGVVHTVEGNSGDAVQQNSYPVGDGCIMGYGVIGEK
ncbi:MAG: CHAP domain-containing protein [Parasporobacterium sp.]|nr:CHAP domain-containing protein [Parasporobacterium sp.]